MPTDPRLEELKDLLYKKKISHFSIKEIVAKVKELFL